MKRDLAEINRKAPQWSHKAVWNKWYMEPKAGLTLSQMWSNAEADIAQKTTRSGEIRDSDLCRVAATVNSLPPSECAATSSEGQSSHTVATDRTQPHTQFQWMPIYMHCHQRGIPTADGLAFHPSPFPACLPVLSNRPSWDTHGWFVRSPRTSWKNSNRKRWGFLAYTSRLGWEGYWRERVTN